MALDRSNITPVDDDGSGTTGTVLDAAFFDAIYDAIDAYAALLGPSEDVPFFAMAGPTALRTFTFPDADATVFTSEGIANDALKILDTDDSNYLSVVPGSNLSADRTLTLVTGDANRTLTLSGNPTLGDWFDQAVKVASSPTFAAVAAAQYGGAAATGTLITNDAQTWVDTEAKSLGGNNTRGFLFVEVIEDDLGAIFRLDGDGNLAREISDPGGIFTAAAGTANSLNIYWSAGNSRYELENRRGGSRTIRLTRIGV